MQLISIPESLAEPKGRGPAGHEVFCATLVPGRCLTARHKAIWRKLQNSNDQLANPCFAPEFTEAVASVRTDVEVALIAQDGEVVAIFPFQRKRGGRAIPVGGIVSDYHGLICRPDFCCNPLELLKACNLVAWDFDRLPASQRFFVPFHKLCEPSAQMDLSHGYRGYVAERRAAGTHQIQRCGYMARRIERALGPLCFIPHSPDSKALAQVLTWKSQQYRRSGWKDLFATDWGRGLAERIQAVQKPAFAGMLSLLYAGDRLIAGHLGMRSATVWHYWFPAYDRQFSKFSPGLVLLLKMAQSAEEFGLKSIDLGTGMSLYKRRLMNASVSVAEGSIERPSGLFLARSLRRGIRSLLTCVSSPKAQENTHGG